jgi:general secretion pathway protein C
MTVRKGLLLSIIIGATFLIAHAINVVIAEALLSPIGPAPSSTSVNGIQRATYSPSTLTDQLRTSGLFPVPQVSPGMTDGTGSPTAIMNQPLNLASKLKLLGVVVGDRGGVSAIVEELMNRRQAFYRLHDEIPDIGEIIDIRNEGIVIQQGGQQELLELAIGQPDKPPVSQTAASVPGKSVPAGSLHKALDRREVEQAMNDLPKLLSQARAVPYLVNGALNGFRLDYVAPASFYEKIGLRYGDVLKQVNGVEIKDPGTMMALFQQLRNEQSVKLNVLRNNQPTTMTFDIR